MVGRQVQVAGRQVALLERLALPVKAEVSRRAVHQSRLPVPEALPPQLAARPARE